ncbi:hypothetical protein [Hymenobacter properus]|uniref:DUF4138 domain-containing protein n=1 Tax=Hymenobacter properus TaxID=2791026 RepID=A0A931FKH7_9BACT|nr:hypothetical protein [Hymenobacter properus]MBF9143068.1 hypothetical protein [Hymenobacter properus]MBR7721876.1 hypothetical protein [Microvirga sp. SRT04]
MNLVRAASLALLCIPLFGHFAAGQAAAPDAALAAAVGAAQQQYATGFALSSQLYNGPEYIDYARPYHQRTGHQFFGEPTRQPGSVFYNGHNFPNLQLAYDVVRDQVVVTPPRSPLSLRFVNENVGSFSLNNHRFVRLVADSANSRVIQTGYYEVLLDSTVQVLARRSKRMQERVVQQGVDVEFVSQDELFIKKAGIYYPASRKSTALRVFADRGKEMQDYAKAQKLSFKKAQFEASLVQLARYYSGLTTR